MIKQKIQELYSSLYAHADVDEDALSSLMTEAGPELTQCPLAMRGPLTADITLEETLAAIKESPNGETPGPDCIPADVYKPIRNLLAPHLTRLFNYVLSSATQFPEGMRCQFASSSRTRVIGAMLRTGDQFLCPTQITKC